MATKYVDIRALMDSLCVDPYECPGCPEPEYLEALSDLFDCAPEADVRENVTARWIRDPSGMFVCSRCKEGYKEQPTLMGRPMFDFCPVCGADMRERGQDD